jgi:hypothetical protein
MYEEPSGIKGSFLRLKSIMKMDKEKKAKVELHALEKDLDFGVVSISSRKSSFMPVSQMEDAISSFKFVDDW